MLQDVCRLEQLKLAGDFNSEEIYKDTVIFLLIIKSMLISTQIMFKRNFDKNDMDRILSQKMILMA